jgi:hypothetical protein
LQLRKRKGLKPGYLAFEVLGLKPGAFKFMGQPAFNLHFSPTGGGGRAVQYADIGVSTGG